MADRLIEAFPPLLPTIVENKKFLNRMVTWAADEGISRFIGVDR